MASKIFIFRPSEYWAYARGTIIVAADNFKEVQEIIEQHNKVEKAKCEAKFAAYADDDCDEEITEENYPSGYPFYEDFYMSQENADKVGGDDGKDWICDLVIDVVPRDSGIIFNHYDVG